MVELESSLVHGSARLALPTSVVKRGNVKLPETLYLIPVPLAQVGYVCQKTPDDFYEGVPRKHLIASSQGSTQNRSIG